MKQKIPDYSSAVILGRLLNNELFKKSKMTLIHRLDKYPKFAIYKYLHKDDIKYYTDAESVLITPSLKYYSIDDSGGKFDPAEKNYGKIETVLNGKIGPSNKLGLDFLEKANIIHVSKGAQAHFNNVEIQSELPDRAQVYMQCFAKEFSEGAMKAWHEAEDCKYDACIKITDTIKYLRLINDKNFETEDNILEITKIKGRFSSVFIDNIHYARFPLDGNVTNIVDTVFIKEIDSFGYQKEIRIVWPKQLEQGANELNWSIPGLNKLVEIVHIMD